MGVLITGGAGFIGSNLCRSLVAARETVRILDDLSTGSRANLSDLNGAVDLVVGDVRDLWTVRRAMDGIEVVFHLAAVPTVARSIADPRRSHDVNATGTLNVLQAAREAEVRILVYASASSIYGDTPTLPKHEGMDPAPRSPYAASKLAGEAYCRAFHHAFGLPTVSLRFFNVFGPRQDPGSEYAAVIPRFATWMIEGRPPVIFGDGTQSRDFTFVANAVQACILAAEAGPDAAGEAMNVGCGQQTTLVGLAAALNRLLGTSIEPLHTDSRPGDVRHSRADLSKARRLLGYQPLVDLDEGLAQTLEWLSERRSLLTHAG
jgi:nucleoside-diphosphate-sugar epimerase